MRKWVIAGVLFGLMGCASGNMKLSTMSPSQLEKFPLGTAEKSDVVQVNGHPMEVVTLPNNHEGWVYTVCRDGDMSQKTRFTIEFGADGRVYDVHCLDANEKLLSARDMRQGN